MRGEDGSIKGCQDSVDYLNRFVATIGESLSNDLSNNGHQKEVFDTRYEPDVNNLFRKLRVAPGLVEILVKDISDHK